MNRRERLREATATEIKQIARQQMAQEGTAAISLRGIARQMELTAPALYRYFPTRDDLITALIVDAFTSLAVAVEETQAAGGKTKVEQLLAVSHVYRRWALTNPTDFQLIYGNPIPNYEAPAELTVPIVVRVFRVFVGLIAEGIAAGEITPHADYQTIPASLSQHFAMMIAQDAYPITPEMMYMGIAGWTQLHGIIMLELFNHLAPTVGDSEAFFQHQIELFYRGMGAKI